MDKKDFFQTMTILGLSYGKEFTTDELGVWYQFFKEKKIEVFKTSINTIIKQNKYMPSIAEINEKCNEIENQYKYVILERMKENGYFKSEREYTKAIHFLDEGVIPQWFKEDMNKFLNENKKLENKEMELIC